MRSQNESLLLYSLQAKLHLDSGAVKQREKQSLWLQPVSKASGYSKEDHFEKRRWILEDIQIREENDWQYHIHTTGKLRVQDEGQRAEPRGIERNCSIRGSDRGRAGKNRDERRKCEQAGGGESHSLEKVRGEGSCWQWAMDMMWGAIAEWGLAL